MTAQAETNVVNNGVNVAALLGARKALEEAPEAAQFKWRAQCEWIDGVHSRSTVEGFYGLGAEQLRQKSFTFDADHPEVFAATDNSATPVEILLSALASCLTAGVASVAQNRGIQLHSVKATVEGDMDIYGILGIDPEVRNGLQRDPSELRCRCRRHARGDQGGRRPVAEAFRRLRHRHQPDQRPRDLRLKARVARDMT